MPVVCVTHYKTSREATTFILNQSVVKELLPLFVKLVSPFIIWLISVSDEVGVSFILHICSWRSALVAWLW